MSFEGYEEYLCEVGHYATAGAWDAPVSICPTCHAPIVWHRVVDETNGIDPNDPTTMPATLVVRVPETVEVCNLGHRHVTRPAQYEIPAGVGLNTPACVSCGGFGVVADPHHGQSIYCSDCLGTGSAV